MKNLTPTDTARAASVALGRSPFGKGADRLAQDLESVPEVAPYVWCSTSCDTPRKHAQPEPTSQPSFRIVLGDDLEDRKVECSWYSNGVRSAIGVNVATLRKMIEVAEAYKPGATISGGGKS